MRYSVSTPVHFEEATPRGLLVVDFPEGEIEPEDESDERYVLEYRLIPEGLASRVTSAAPEAPVAAPEAPAAPVEPEVAPEPVQPTDAPSA